MAALFVLACEIRPYIWMIWGTKLHIKLHLLHSNQKVGNMNRISFITARGLHPRSLHLNCGYQCLCQTVNKSHADTTIDLFIVLFLHVSNAFPFEKYTSASCASDLFSSWQYNSVILTCTLYEYIFFNHSDLKNVFGLSLQRAIVNKSYFILFWFFSHTHSNSIRVYISTFHTYCIPHMNVAWYGWQPCIFGSYMR